MQKSFPEEFDGIDDFAALGTDPTYDPQTNSFSVSFWMKAKAITRSAHFIVSKGNAGSTDEGWSFYLSDRTLYFRVTDRTARRVELHIPYADEWNWNHVAAAIDRVSGKVSGYVNGEPMYFEPTSRDLPELGEISPPQALEVGRRNDGVYFFNGLIRDLQIYRYALTTEELRRLSHREKKLPTAAMIITPSDGYGPMTITADASGSFDIDGNIVSYQWEFGDGTSATGVNVEHEFRSAGVYPVSLAVSDNDGGRSIRTKEIFVHSVYPLFEETAVFRRRTGGYHSFRIPTITKSMNGELLAFCEGRINSVSDFGDHDIVLRRSSNRGRTWNPMQVVVDHRWFATRNWRPAACMDPVPVVDASNKRIWLAFTVIGNYNPVRAPYEFTVWVTQSDDDGATWAAPREITSSVKLPTWDFYSLGPCHGIQLSGGRLFIMGNHSDESDRFFSHAFFSDDHGASWQLGGTVGPDTNEATAIELDDGTVMMNMRSYRHGGNPGMRAVAISSDRGATWGPVMDEAQLVEPRCQASIIRFTDRDLHDRNRILFSNPAAKTRRNLTVKISYDEGKTWNAGKTIFEHEAAYSDLVILDDFTIGCLYERGSQPNINFVRFDLNWLTSGQDALGEFKRNFPPIEVTLLRGAGTPFSFLFRGENHRIYTVEASRDCQNWKILEVIKGEEKLHSFTESRTGLDRQYYRVRVE